MALLDGTDHGFAADADALLFHFPGEAGPHVLVEAAKDVGGADDLGDLDADGVVDPGELDGDVAAADDDEAVRQLGHVERLVRAHDVLDAGNVRRRRPAAGGDEDLLGGDAAPVDLDGMGIRQPAGAFDELDVVVSENAPVDALQTVEFGVLALDQHTPVDLRRHVEPPAVAERVLEVVGEVRGVDEQLFRHTAADDAGAADAALLDDRGPCAIAAGQPGGADAAGTGADGDEVVVEAAHPWLPAVDPDLLKVRRGRRT